MILSNKLKWNVLIMVLLKSGMLPTDSVYLKNSTIFPTADSGNYDDVIMDSTTEVHESGISLPNYRNHTEEHKTEENPNGYITELPYNRTNPEQLNVSANPHVNESENVNVSANPHVNETENVNVSANPHVNETENVNVGANPHVNETENVNVSTNPHVNETENVNVSANPHVNETEQPKKNNLPTELKLTRKEYDSYIKDAKCENSPVTPLFINETYVIISWTDYQWIILCTIGVLPKIVCVPPYNPVSRKYEDYTTMGIITEIYLCIPLCVLGIVGNILSFITLSREKQNTSILILKSLAVIDSLYLLLVVVFQPYYTAYHDTDWVDKSTLDKLSHTFTKSVRYATPVINMAQMCSAWLVVFLTIDRYIAICHPFKAMIYCTKKCVKVGITFVILLSIVYNIPVFWEIEYKQIYHECLKLHMFVTGSVRGSLGQNIYFRIIYGLAGNLIFRNLLPVLIVITLNSCLIHSLRESKNNREKMTPQLKDGQDNKDKNITATLVSISFVYLLCILPMMILSMLDIYFNSILQQKQNYIIDYYYESKKDVASWQIYLKFELVVRFLVRVNSAINFLVYCIVRKGFRGKLLNLFKKEFRGKLLNPFKKSVKRETSFQTSTTSFSDKLNQRI